MNVLPYATAFLLFTTPLVYAEKLGDALSVNAEAINQAQKFLESGKKLKQGELTNVLVNRLGITPEQASGGAGALLQIAQTRMKPEEFAQLSAKVPDIQQLLSAVPAMKPQSGLGGLAGKLAGLSGDSSIGTALTAVSVFQQLGMKPETMQKFVPVVMEYVKGNTGGAVAEGLGAALSLQKK